MLTLDKVMADAPALLSSTDSEAGRVVVAGSGRERLPVKDPDGRFVGMLSTDSLGGDTCGQAAELAEPMIAADAPTTLLRLFAEQESDTVAVVDNKRKLLGIADRLLTLKAMALLTGAAAPGCTLAVETRRTDYEAGRIASIAEMSGACVVSLLTEGDGDRVRAYVKIAQENPYPVVEALERHGYAPAVLTASYDMPKEEDEMRRNYDALMDYLRIGQKEI